MPFIDNLSNIRFFPNLFSAAKETQTDFPLWKVVRTLASITHSSSRPSDDARCPRRPEVHSAPRERPNGSSTQRPKAVGLLSSQVVMEMRIRSIALKNVSRLVQMHFRRKLKLSPRFDKNLKKNFQIAREIFMILVI